MIKSDSTPERAFLEYIKEDIPDIDDELFQEILDNGIENVDQWEDAYVCTMPTSIRVEAQFVEPVSYTHLTLPTSDLV